MIKKWLLKIIHQQIDTHYSRVVWPQLNDLYDKLSVLENKPTSLKDVIKKHKIKPVDYEIQEKNITVKMLDGDKTHTFKAKRSSNGRFAKK